VLSVNIIDFDVNTTNPRVKWFDRCENVADLRPATISANNKIEVLLNPMSEV